MQAAKRQFILLTRIAKTVKSHSFIAVCQSTFLLHNEISIDANGLSATTPSSPPTIIYFAPRSCLWTCKIDAETPHFDIHGFGIPFRVYAMSPAPKAQKKLYNFHFLVRIFYPFFRHGFMHCGHPDSDECWCCYCCCWCRQWWSAWQWAEWVGKHSERMAIIRFCKIVIVVDLARRAKICIALYAHRRKGSTQSNINTENDCG